MARSLRCLAAISVIAVLVALLVACSASPRDVALRNGMTESEIVGTDYRHVVFRKPGAGGRLHIYLDGDGRPWINGRVPSTDPTPANPLTLRLMALDSADVAYIGRPCYLGTAGDPGCGPQFWTSGRYSSRLAASMAAVANQVIAAGDYGEVVLIGYSGGGVIALLMSEEIQGLAGILTVAANIDTAAWTEYHHYLPLSGSENPALSSTSPPPGVLHVQAIGGRDEIVPAVVSERYQAQKKGMEVWEYRDYDHVCCWASAWPQLLARFDARLMGDAAESTVPVEPVPQAPGKN
jgi:pimeloyl-ACP methyl ester carboxylesterase